MDVVNRCCFVWRAALVVCVWWLFGWCVVSYSAGTATVKTEIFLTNVNRTGTD